jgi:hypothetical protein
LTPDEVNFFGKGEQQMSMNAPIWLAFFSLLGAEIFAQGSGCPDDFRTSRIGAGQSWTFIDRDNATGGSAQVVGSRLEVSGKGEDIFNAKNFFVGVYRTDIKGDFDVSVKIISQSNTNAWAQAGILVANSAEDLKQGGYFVLDLSPGNALNAFYDAKDTVGWLESRVGNIGTTAYPAWLRVKKANKKFSSWYRNSESEAWKVVAENLSPQLTAQDSHVALFSVSHNTSMEGTAVFDDFACLHEASTGISIRGVKLKPNSSVALRFLTADGRTAHESPPFTWKIQR